MTSIISEISVPLRENLLNNNIGKELEKVSDEEDIELPPELPAVM